MLITEFIELYPQFKNSRAIKHSLHWRYKTIDEDYWYPFRIACETGKLELVQKFIDLGAPINIEDYDWTGLEYASIYGHIEIVKLLLQKGANVHCNNNRSVRLAIQYAHIEIVKILLIYYNPNYIIRQKLHKIIDNEVLTWYYNYIHKIRIIQKQCKHYLHKPGGPFFLNGLRQLI